MRLAHISRKTEPSSTRTPLNTSIVLTGSEGFIGKHLHAALRAKDTHVISYDSRNGVEEDITTAYLAPAAWCFHLAAETNAQSADKDAMFRTNVEGTERLAQVYGERLIFASTWAVHYPGTPYADSKIQAEEICEHYSCRVLRLCNIFGPGGHGVIDTFARSDVLDIRGKGTQIRTYAHINHAIQGLLAMVASDPGEVGALRGANMTVLDIASAFYPDKKLNFVPQNPLDIEDGTQIYVKETIILEG